MADAMEFAIAYRERILRMFLRVARGDRECAEEMYSSVAIERLPRILELWDGQRPLENYAMNALRWYAFKWVNKRKLMHLRYGAELTEAHPALDMTPVLDEACEDLTELETYLLRAVVEYGMTPREIAKQLNWTVPVVKRSLQYVKEKVRCGYVDSDWFFVKEAIRLMVLK